jgi:hypothetical protein
MDVAGFARRLVAFADGRVVRDVPVEQRAAAEPAA